MDMRNPQLHQMIKSGTGAVRCVDIPFCQCQEFTFVENAGV